MKNSFEASFEKRTNTDGSIDLVYKTETNWTEVARFLYLGGAGIAVLFLIGSLILLLNSGSRLGGIVLGLMSAGYLYFGHRFLESNFVQATKNIRVIPGVGIEFDGKSAPFADITEIGNGIYTNRPGIGYLYIETRGVRVEILAGGTAFVKGLQHAIVELSNGKFSN